MAVFEHLERKIDTLVRQARSEGVFSCCTIAIAQGKECLVKGYGTLAWHDTTQVNNTTLFDLASLTKALATTPAILTLIARRRCSLTDSLPGLLEMTVPADKKDITLFQLLNHCAGLAAHRHFYTSLENIPLKLRKAELLRLILAEPLEYPVGSRALYSDLGFILLGMVVEKKSGFTLEEVVAKDVLGPLQLAHSLIYNPLEKGFTQVAATEECPWRQRLLQGEVDDQNTWVVGGVSGQAGLFGGSGDVLTLVRNLVEIASGSREHPWLEQEILKKAMSRQGVIKESCWGLGFDTPAATGSSAGSLIARRSCGHLGFTGTSFWHDFDKDITVVLLTNRIHPRVDNFKIKAFRPLFHDLIFKTMGSQLTAEQIACEFSSKSKAL